MLGKIKLAGIAIKAFALANGPIALFAGGLIVGALALIEVAKAAPDVEAEVAPHEEAIEQLNSELADPNVPEEDKEDDRAAKRKEGKAVAGCFLRGYRKAIILAICAFVLLVCGFLWQSKRLAIAAATAASQAATIKIIDDNIRKTYGDKAVFAMHDPNWDPAILERGSESEGGNGALANYSDPYRNYKVNDSIKNAVDHDNNIYLYNKFTIDSAYYDRAESSNWTTEFIRIINIINEEVAKANMYLSGKMMKPILSRSEFLCENLGFIFAGYGEYMDEIDEGLRMGWGKGDIIDVGISDIVADIGRHTNDKNYLDRLADEYRDGIPLKLNCTLNPRENFLVQTYEAWSNPRRKLA